MKYDPRSKISMSPPVFIYSRYGNPSNQITPRLFSVYLHFNVDTHHDTSSPTPTIPIYY